MNNTLKKIGLRDLIHSHVQSYLDSHTKDVPPVGVYGHVISEVECALLQAVMEKAKGNQVQASRILGVSRNTLRKKVKTLNLDGA
jgi:two-component system, NtrC family, nitrogen regulation response regulator GlnG